MKKSSIIKLTVLASLVLIAGCATRSISNSGYRDESSYGRFHYGQTDAAFRYEGELSEFEVLGIERDLNITEEQIGKALEVSRPVRVPIGSSILVIQSGAAYPDDPMAEELNKYYRVTPFSGIPAAKGTNSYSKNLRYAAALGGHSAIVCYWGILETAQKSLATKNLSWVPVVGWNLPDEKQHMRIRLKMAIIDVRTGNWAMFYPQSFDSKAISTMLTRRNSDQAQVQELKDNAYVVAAQDMAKLYATKVEGAK